MHHGGSDKEKVQEGRTRCLADPWELGHASTNKAAISKLSGVSLGAVQICLRG